MKLKDLPMYILAGLIIIGFFVVLGLLLFKPIPETNQRVLDMLLGALVTCFIAIVMYWFGSSKGSADKTEMINKKSNEN